MMGLNKQIASNLLVVVHCLLWIGTISENSTLCQNLPTFSDHGYLAFTGNITRLMVDPSQHVTSDVKIVRVHQDDAMLQRDEVKIQRVEEAFSCGHQHELGDYRMWVVNRNSAGNLTAKASLDVTPSSVQTVLRSLTGPFRVSAGVPGPTPCNSQNCVTQCSAQKLMKGKVTSIDPNHYIGSELLFECNDGYDLVGVDTLTCTETGWNRKKPYCKVIKCPDPGPFPNGLIYGRDYRIGQTVRFSCYQGYQLLGSVKRICLKNRHWDGALPACDDGNSHCPALSTPINGFKYGSQYVDQGDIVKFSCEDGHVLRGSSVRLCMQNRQWNGTEALCIDENEANFKDVNETAFLLRSHLLETVLENPCTQHQSICTHIASNGDSRDRAIDVVFTGELDIVFVFDGSSSIRKKAFKNALRFAKALVKLIGRSRNGLPRARFAVVGFGTVAQVEFNLENNTREVVKRIGKIKRLHGGTASAPALELVHKAIAPLAGDGKRVLVIFTDGISNIGGPPGMPAEKLKKEDLFQIYAIGIGRLVHTQELLNIASRPGKEHVIQVSHFDTLVDAMKKVAEIKLDYSPCGVSKAGERGRIVDGRKADHGLWPWMSRLYMVNNGKLRLHCGGALIHPQWVLTAAHCFYSYKDFFGFKTSDAHHTEKYRLAFGYISSREIEKFGYVIEKIFVHPKFDSDVYDNDIALVKLRKEVVLTQSIRTVCLPEEDIAVPGTNGIVAGWGVTEVVNPLVDKKHPTSKVLRYAAFTIQKDSICSNKTTYHVNANVMFCAGDGKGGKDACKGDSGGPFITEASVDGQNRWMAIGLVSWGEGCGWVDKYGYYTRVGPFLDWIKETMKKNTVVTKP